jgi:peptidoglycan/LPS O-acetylase OafA/YrhL
MAWYLRPSYGGLWFVGTLFWLTILFPLFLRLIRRFSIERVLLVVLILNLLVRMVSAFPTATGVDMDAALYAFRIRADEFVLGMAIAFLRAHGSKPHLPWIQSIGGILMTLFGFVLFDLARIGQIPYLGATIAYSLIGIGLTLIIDVVLSWPERIQSIIFPSPLRYLGKMSYSLYLIHGVLIVPFNPMVSVTAFARYVSATGLLSALSYRYLEHHGRLPSPTPDTQQK